MDDTVVRAHQHAAGARTSASVAPGARASAEKPTGDETWSERCAGRLKQERSVIWPAAASSISPYKGRKALAAAVGTLRVMISIGHL